MSLPKKVYALVAAVFAISLSSVEARATPSFLEKLERFERTFEDRFQNDFPRGLEEDLRWSAADRIVARDLSVRAVTETRRLTADFAAHYRASFLGGEGESSATALDQAELRLVVTSNRLLRAAADSLVRADSRPLARAVARFGETAVSRGLAETWRMTAPFTRNALPVARAMLIDLLLRNQSVIDVFGAEAFSRKFLKPGTRLTISKDLKTLPIEPDAVVFGVMNHDVVLLEGLLISQLADQLGAKEKLTLTIKSAYPHFRVRSNPDPRVLLADEPQVASRLLTRINQTAGLVTVGVFPEGTRSGFAAQVPLSTKPGVPVMALRLARQAGRPVYVLPLRYNGLEYVTTATLDLNLEVGEPIRVQPTKSVKTETERLRLMIEDFIGFERGRRMIDLTQPRKVAGTSGVYCAEELK